MKCPYCGVEFEIEALEAYRESLKETETEEKAEWEGYDKTSGSGDWQEGELDALSSNECPSCGAEIVGDQNTIATCCPYCGNSNIVKSRVRDMFKPDYVIPFKQDRDAAVKALEEFQKHKLLLPSTFTTSNRIEKIQAVYVPFWIYDCDAWGHINYRATTITAWSSGNYDYTKTDIYACVREGELVFERVPADGSQRMDDTLMDSIEPYDYSTMVEFNTAYLSGYLAEKYDVDAEQNKERVNKRIRNSVEQLFKRDVTGYTTVHTEGSNINLDHGRVRYALFPVWMVNTVYNDKRYTFAMNGQTGKLTGELPVSPARSVAMISAVFAVLTVVFSGIIYFLYAQGAIDLDGGSESKGLYYLAVAFLALVISLVNFFLQRAKHKTARPQHFAGDYIKKGSLRFRVRKDTFISTFTTRTKRQEK
jgi:DNA-directed RNA polymerase subunit RPC12/RpoP